MNGYIFILLLLGAFWLLMIRPAQRRQKQQQQLLSSVEEGAEIVTAGGLYGIVKGFEDDELRVEIAPGVEVRIARRAVAGVMPEPEEEEPEELEEEEPGDLEAHEPVEVEKVEPAKSGEA